MVVKDSCTPCVAGRWSPVEGARINVLDWPGLSWQDVADIVAGCFSSSPCCCMQLWRKYLTNTKVSFVENDAECARKHKADIEAVAKGKVYVGESHGVCNV